MNVSDLGFEYPESELVLGFVYAVGTDGKHFRDILEDLLKTKFGYNVNSISLSGYLTKLYLGIALPEHPEAARINSRMDGGNKARREAGRAEFLALAAVSQIAASRPVSAEDHRSPLNKTVHLVSSLKRPEEVIALRRIYGPGFFLIALFATKEQRRSFLIDRKGIPPTDADALLKRDEEEEDEQYGQRTRDTFELADVFIDLSAGDDSEKQLWRFLTLLFGHPFQSPTRDENAMYMAYAASLRSASLSRQVGASLITEGHEVVSIGCNDVPCAGGGLYWPGESDQRDHVRGYDSNDKRRKEIIDEIANKLAVDPVLVKKTLQGSSLHEITEYGRAVHAEMEAILACARAGISPLGGTLYTTTFPCHSCTRHIIAAGIKRVVYIEPYPKSYAEDLHSDAIQVLAQSTGAKHPKKVIFESFVGVGPRRYMDLFSTKLSNGYPIERKADGIAKDWAPGTAVLRIPLLPASYLEREQLVVRKIENTMERLAGRQKT